MSLPDEFEAGSLMAGARERVARFLWDAYGGYASWDKAPECNRADYQEEAEQALDVSGLPAEITSLRAQLRQAEDQRDDLRTDHDALLGRVERQWPRCPDGCGCLMDGEDADRRECGCTGPCTTECAENGYPGFPSYRDLAREARE